MKRKTSIFVAVMMALIMILSMSGCGVSKSEADELFSGEMVDAQNERIVVRGENETMLFATTDETEYILEDESEICIGDTIEVDFHKGSDMYVADSVRLVAHEKHPAVFGGEVTELMKSYLTVQSESLTIVFNRDDNTKIEGDLSKGDSVIVTYEGNLSENPQAVSIVVIKENKEKKEKNLHGKVAEIGEKSAVISVDSAHACRMKITSDTTFRGDDTKLKIGDEVFVVYTGTAGADCVAKSITISRKQVQTQNQTQTQQNQNQTQAQNQTQIYYVMDGVIDKVSSNGIVVRTSQNSYTFGIVKETRIKNRDYMKAGHKTTITYSGELEKNPVAASIFCSKDTVTEKEKKNASKTAEAAETSKTGNASNSKDNAQADNSSASKESSTSEDSSKAKEDTKSEESSTSKDEKETGESSSAKEKEKSPEGTETPETDSVIIKARGEVLEWANPCIIKVDGAATMNLDIIDASVSGGYIPQTGDQVLIIYDKDEMKLLDIQLEYRPAKANTMVEKDSTVSMNANDASAETNASTEKKTSSSTEKDSTATDKTNTATGTTASTAKQENTSTEKSTTVTEKETSSTEKENTTSGKNTSTTTE